MTNTTPVPSPVETPSGKRLALATSVAAVVAGIVLVTAVLPAEYGIDPIGTGRPLGLLDLYDASAGAEVYPAAEAEAAEAQESVERPRIYKVESTEFTLAPGQGFEYKYELAKGAGMVYAWKATGPVNYEFHGDPQDRTLKVISYEKAAGDYASGTLTAPYTGIHGWFWENAGTTAVTVSLTSAGFYSRGLELRPKYNAETHRTTLERVPHELPDATGK